MVSVLSKTDFPVNRVDVLHILRLHDDNLDQLSTEQIAAIRRIYSLDDDRTVEQRLRDGDLVPVTPADIREFVEVSQ